VRGRAGFSLALAALLLASPLPTASQAVVTEKPEAPLVYRLSRAPSVMIANRDEMRRLAYLVEQRSAARLSASSTRDEAVRRELYAARRTAAFVRGDLVDAARFDRAATNSQALSVATDLLIAAARAERQAGQQDKMAAVRRAVRGRLTHRGPADRDQVIALRRELALASSAFRLGEITGFADPEWRNDPEVRQSFAVGLMQLWVEIELRNRYLDTLESELSRWLEQHRAIGPNIWVQRQAPPATSPTEPVTIAIWDGVDAALFAPLLKAEPGDRPNGKDDDGDGFIDEAEGLAFDEHFKPSSGLQMAVPDAIASKLTDFERYMRGRGELAVGLDSPDVAFARTWRRSLSAAEVVAFEEAYEFYANYSHGTRVADVAVRGVPQATLVPVRMTFSSKTPAPVLDEAAAARFVSMVETATRYMRARGVRVCNISWGFTEDDVEHSLRQSGMATDGQTRATRAKAIFATMQSGMTRAMAASPDILFVVSAGNAGQNIDLAGDLPGTINLANVLTVGAAKENGKLAGFASTGPSVDLYALGTSIEALVPGGGRVLSSGASLSAPQVVNAAARMLSHRPELTTADLVRLLLQTASPVEGSDLLLLDARAALAASHRSLSQGRKESVR
jgi:Subtilase family